MIFISNHIESIRKLFNNNERFSLFTAATKQHWRPKMNIIIWGVAWGLFTITIFSLLFIIIILFLCCSDFMQFHSSDKKRLLCTSIPNKSQINDTSLNFWWKMNDFQAKFNEKFYLLFLSLFKKREARKKNIKVFYFQDEGKNCWKSASWLWEIWSRNKINFNVTKKANGRERGKILPHNITFNFSILVLNMIFFWVLFQLRLMYKSLPSNRPYYKKHFFNRKINF